MLSVPRRVLTCATVAGLAALALSGCAAGSGSSSSDVFTSIDLNQSIDVNAPINPYSAKANEYSGYNEEQLAWSNNSLTDPNDMIPGLAKSWSLSSDGHTLTIHLQPGAKWSDGTPVTATDVKTSFGLAIAEAASPVTVKAVNDSTVAVTEAPGAQSNTFPETVLSTVIVPNSYWGAKIPASLWTDAATASNPKSSPAAQQKASAAITSLGKTLVTDGPTSDISAGPFTLERVNPGEAVFTKNASFFAASNVDPTTVVLKSYASGNQIWGYLKAGQLDASPYVSTPAAVQAAILKVKGNATVSAPSQVSAALAFNQNDAPYNNVHVRRGLAYLINRATVTKIGESTSGSTSGPTSGMIAAANKLYLPDMSSFNNYSVDATQAAAEFTQAGMTQKGGKWYLANGKPFTVDITAPNGFPDWVAGGQSIVSQLNAAGVTAALETSADYPTYLQDLADGKIPFGFWLVSLAPGPYGNFQRIYGNSGGWNASGANVAYSKPGVNGNWMGMPETETVNGKTINPGKVAAQLQFATGSKEKALTQELATLTNQQLPIIQMWDYVNVQYVNTTRFTDFPKANTGILNDSPGVWIANGYVKAVK